MVNVVFKWIKKKFRGEDERKCIFLKPKCNLSVLCHLSCKWKYAVFSGRRCQPAEQKALSPALPGAPWPWRPEAFEPLPFRDQERVGRGTALPWGRGENPGSHSGVSQATHVLFLNFKQQQSLVLHLTPMVWSTQSPAFNQVPTIYF